MKLFNKAPATLLFVIIPLFSLAIITATPQVSHADKICQKMEKRVDRMVTRINKFWNKVLPKAIGKYNALAPHFLKQKDVDKLTTLNQTINRVEGDCGQSLTNWCPWTCYSEEWMWPLPPQCQGCWFQWDENVPNMCSWTMNQSMAKVYSDRDKLVAAATKKEGRARKKPCKIESKGARLIAIKDSLEGNCNLTPKPLDPKPTNGPSC